MSLVNRPIVEAGVYAGIPARLSTRVIHWMSARPSRRDGGRKPDQRRARPALSLRGMAIANAGAWLALAVGGIATTAILYRVFGPATYGVWATVAALRAFALLLDGGIMFGASGAAARFRSDPDGHALTFAVRC